MKTLVITAAIFLAVIGLALADGSVKNNFDMRGMMNENFGMGMAGMMMGNMMGGGMMAYHNSDSAGKMHGMMDSNSDMNEMHSMMHGSGEVHGAGCMGMMHNSESMSAEEKEKMFANMDKDGDGKCDMCGMPIEMCRKMMEN